MEKNRVVSAYFNGLRSGVDKFSYYKNGETYVGIYGLTMRTAMADIAREEDIVAVKISNGFMSEDDLCQ
jgi:hypothetical protein